MQLTYVESLRLTMTMLLRRWTPGLDSGDVLTDASEGARCRLHPRLGAHPCCSGYASRRSRRARHIARLTTRGRVARRRFAAPGRVRCRSARLRAAQSPSRRRAPRERSTGIRRRRSRQPRRALPESGPTGSGTPHSAGSGGRVATGHRDSHDSASSSRLVCGVPCTPCYAAIRVMPPRPSLPRAPVLEKPRMA